MDPYASALDQAAAVRRKEISSVELTKAYLDRIDKLNPKLNAYVLITAEVALAQALEADAAGPRTQAVRCAACRSPSRTWSRWPAIR